MPIASIAIRSCPGLPPTIEERIADNRAQTLADSVMYRMALAGAAEARGWTVHWYDRKRVLADAAAALAGDDVDRFLRAMGRSIGPPWQADHKLAAAENRNSGGIFPLEHLAHMEYNGAKMGKEVVMPSNKPKKAAGAGQRSKGARAVPAKPKAAAAEPQLPGYTVVAALEGSTVKPDSKGRILIGEAVRFAAARGLPKPDAYKPVVGEYGEILLIPVNEIPTRELWLYQNPEANASLERGIQQAREGQYIRGRSFAEHADVDLEVQDDA